MGVAAGAIFSAAIVVPARTRYWRSWPIAAWLGELSGNGTRWFALTDDRFHLAELVDGRLARYLDKQGTTLTGAAVLKVLRSGDKPILMLDREHNPPLPERRDVDVIAEGRTYRMDFVKVAINVAHLDDTPGNALHGLLWHWFGPDAGRPGTNYRVTVEYDHDGSWQMRPNEPAPGAPPSVEQLPG